MQNQQFGTDRVMQLGVALTHLPASLGHPGVNASLTFSAPRALPPLIASPSEWKTLSHGILGVARGVADLKGVPDAAGIAKGLAAIAWASHEMATALTAGLAAFNLGAQTAYTCSPPTRARRDCDAGRIENGLRR